MGKFKHYKGHCLLMDVEVIVLNVYNVDGLDETESHWDAYLKQTESEQKETEIAAQFKIMRQQFELQEQRIAALTIKLQQMDKYAIVMQEMSNKITMIVANVNDKTVMDQQREQQMAQMMQWMQEWNSKTKQQTVQTNDDQQQQLQDETKNEERETKQLKNFFHKILKMEQYYQLFVDDGYDDLESVMGIGMDDLESIGIQKNGHKKKILREIQKLADQNQEQMDFKNYCQTWRCACGTMNLSETILCTSCGKTRVNKQKQEDEEEEEEGVQ